MAKKISSLIDPITGRPIEYETLGQEVAAPTLGGVRSVMATTPIGDLDPYKISRILRAAQDGEADAYYELAEAMEEKYLHYLGVLSTRKRAVSQLEITVNAASDEPEHQKHADLIREWAERDTLDDELFDILDAVGKGISFTEIVWETTAKSWLPKKLIRRDPKWFEFDRVDGDTPLLKNDMGMPTVLPPYKFIVHRHKAKSGLTIRGGLARAAIWAYLFQNFALKDWMIFAEVFGMPIRLGKYGANATAEDKRRLMHAVMSIGTDAAAIIPDSMQIEFQNAMSGSASADVFERLCQYLDRKISIAVVGQTATTDAEAGGLGGSQGNVHNDVREDIQKADAKTLAASLNRDLVRPIIDFNFGPPSDGNYPRIKIGQVETLTKDQLDSYWEFADRGGEIEDSWLRDKLGIPDPEKGAKLVGKKQQNSPADPKTDLSKKTPQAPTEGQDGADVAKNNPDALLEASYSSYGANFIAAAKSNPNPEQPDDGKDEIDGLIEKIDAGEFGGWELVMAPKIDPILEAAKKANSFDELKAAMLELEPKMDAGAMTELLARSLFAARLNGELSPEGKTE